MGAKPAVPGLRSQEQTHRVPILYRRRDIQRSSPGQQLREGLTRTSQSKMELVNQAEEVPVWAGVCSVSLSPYGTGD